MFDSPADAAKALAGHYDPPRIEILVGALVPAIVLQPVPGSTVVVGGTRFGGVPDLPPGMDWPRPPPVNVDETVRSIWGDVPDTYQSGGKDSEPAWRSRKERADETRSELSRRLPYLFIGQIDLEEAAKLGSVASALPPDGRLLFFYDLVVGCYEAGTRPARVIWDRSPRETLAPARMPDDMAAAEASERKAREDSKARYNLKEKVEGTVYSAPPTSAKLKATLRLPHPGSLDIAGVPELGFAFGEGWHRPGSEGVRDRYHEVLDRYDEPHPRQPWWRQQLLGSPSPEQRDPREDAVIVSDFGKQSVAFEEWGRHIAEITRRAADWRLLLQVDNYDLMREEGSIYFLIRRSDLEERRFDRVVPVYQQT